MPNPKRCWSDWAGFAIYLSLAIHLLIVSRSALLLMPTFLHELLIAGLFLRRKPARANGHALWGRGAAYLGSFLLPVTVWMNQRFLWYSPHVRQDRIAEFGFVFWSIGVVFGLVTLYFLRDSFSLEPQARELVTAGPYQLVRHPIYLGYMLQYGGMALMSRSLFFGGIVAAWFAITLCRIHFEETILASTFAPYRRYLLEVPMIVPFSMFAKPVRPVERGVKRWVASAK